MEVGKHLVRIKDYGINQSKAGGMFVFIDIEKDDVTLRWYGSPIKKDGTPNEMCLAQLVACGFDLEKDISSLGEGIDSGLLVTDEDIDCVVANEMNGKGEMEAKVKWLGVNPTPRLSTDEVKALITDEQRDKLKALSSKFKTRTRKKVASPDEEVPF